MEVAGVRLRMPPGASQPKRCVALAWAGPEAMTRRSPALSLPVRAHPETPCSPSPTRAK